MRGCPDRLDHEFRDIVRAIKKVIVLAVFLWQEERLVTCTILIHVRYIQTAVVCIIATAGKKYPSTGAVPRMVTLRELGICAIKLPVTTGLQFKDIKIGIPVPYVETTIFGHGKKQIAPTWRNAWECRALAN